MCCGVARTGARHIPYIHVFHLFLANHCIVDRWPLENEVAAVNATYLQVTSMIVVPQVPYIRIGQQDGEGGRESNGDKERGSRSKISDRSEI